MNQTTQTPVAQPIAHALDFNRRNEAYEQGARCAELNRASLEILDAGARTLGTDPTFEEFTEYSVQWKDGYVHQNPNNTANAADQAWNRYAKQLSENFGIEKPKSKSAHAEKKAAERSKKAEALLSKYQDQTVADLQAQRRAALEAAAKGSEAAEKLAADLKKVLRVKQSDENKAHGEQLKAMRTKVREAASKCTDLDKLTAALDCMDDNAEINFIYDDHGRETQRIVN